MELKREKDTQFVCPSVFQSMELKWKKIHAVCLFISLSDDGTETEIIHTVCFSFSLSVDGTETGKNTHSLFVYLFQTMELKRK